MLVALQAIDQSNQKGLEMGMDRRMRSLFLNAQRSTINASCLGYARP